MDCLFPLGLRIIRFGLVGVAFRKIQATAALQLSTDVCPRNQRRQRDVCSEEYQVNRAQHPFREDSLALMNITPYRLAKATGIDQTRVSEIIRGKRSITVDTALRFSRYFGNSPEFWINLQTAYDIDEKKGKISEDLQKITPARVRGKKVA